MTCSPDSKFVPALGFSWLTRYYDSIVGISTRERTIKQALIRQACLAPRQRVLDLAAGTGTLVIWMKLHEPLAEIIGVDGDPTILAMAIRKAKIADVTTRFDCALSYHLPYPGAYFDRVVSSLFFHHLSWEDKLRTAHELFRVLKPGAELHVADWGRATSRVMRGLFYFVQLLDGFENTQDNVSGRLITLFEQAGFDNVRQRQSYRTIFGTMALYGAIKPG